MIDTKKSFTLTMKIGTQFIKLSLSQEDSQESICRKFFEAYPNCTKSFHEVLTKLKRQLEILSKRDDIKQSLRQSVKLFYQKLTKQKQSSRQEWPLSQIAINSRIKSCHSDLILLPQMITKNQQTQTEPAEYVRLEHSINVQKHFTQADQKSQKGHLRKSKEMFSTQRKTSLVNKSILIQQQQANNQNLFSSVQLPKKKKTQNISKSLKKKCNPDMIKACEIIMKKTNQSDMKTMAKQFLRQKGYLNEQKICQNKQKRKTIYVTHQKTKGISPQYKQKTIHQNPEVKIPQRLPKNIDAQVLIEVSKRNQQIRSKYKYLQSSLMSLLPNQQLNKQYNNRQDNSSSGLTIPQKKYSYFDNIPI